MAKEHNHELVERIRRGEIYSVPCQESGDSKARRRDEKVGHTYRHGPNHSTSNDTTAHTNLLATILGQQLRLPSGPRAKDAIERIKEYAEQGYTQAVVLDLSKYFDTLNHTILLNLLRKEIKDERVIQMVKRYLKSGVMENGVVTETGEGSPQGGNISPLLANVYLNEFDWEFQRRGVPCIRYADDIVLLAKSERAAKRLLESSTKYLEETLKLKVNREKSRTVSVFAIRNFKYLGFCSEIGKEYVYRRPCEKYGRRSRINCVSSLPRSKCGSIIKTMEER